MNTYLFHEIDSPDQTDYYESEEQLPQRGPHRRIGIPLSLLAIVYMEVGRPLRTARRRRGISRHFLCKVQLGRRRAGVDPSTADSSSG